MLTTSKCVGEAHRTDMMPHLVALCMALLAATMLKAVVLSKPGATASRFPDISGADSVRCIWWK